VVYFLTDGADNVQTPNFVTSANNAKSSGITIVAIGVADADRTQLVKVASLSATNDPLVFNVTNFAELNNIRDQLVGVTCSQLPGNPCGSGCSGFCACGTCTCPVCDTRDFCNVSSCTVGIAGSGCTYAPRDCDDNDVCTTDSCSTQQAQCNHVDNSARCNDGSACTVDSCHPTNDCINRPVSCFSVDPCVDPYCDITLGCQYDRLKECSLCKLPPQRQVVRTCPDPSSPYTFEHASSPPDLCLLWSCSSDPNNATTRTFNNTNYSLGRCVTQPVSCDDGNACTTEQCDSSTGHCRYYAVHCDDGNPCTHDSCDARTGCVHTNFTVAADCPSDNLCIEWTLNSTNPACCVGRDLTYDLCGWNITSSMQCISYECKPEGRCNYFLRDCGLEYVNLGDCQVAECQDATGCSLSSLTGKLDKCKECDGDAVSKDICVGDLTVSEVAGLSAGIVALIIIIVVVVCIALGVVGGKVGMAYYKKYRVSDLSAEREMETERKKEK
jgi:hypothetical protein